MFQALSSKARQVVVALLVAVLSFQLVPQVNGFDLGGIVVGPAPGDQVIVTDPPPIERPDLEVLGGGILFSKPPIDWEESFGTLGVESGVDLQPISTGGYIAVGTGYYTDTEAVVIARMLPNGQEVWTKVIGDVDEGRTPRAIDETLDGGFIIAGSARSLDTGETNPDNDAFLMKVNSAGDLQWVKRYGNSDYTDQAYDVEATSDGGYIFTGFTKSYGTHRQSLYVVKTDSSGDVEFDKAIGNNTSTFQGNAVQETADGGFVLVGYANDSDGIGRMIYLHKMHSDGTHHFHNYYGYGTESGEDVKQLENGGFVIVGTTRWAVPDTTHAYLVRVSSTGKFLWDKAYAHKDSYSTAAKSVDLTSDGGYILAGTNSLSAYAPGADNYVEGYVVKTDNNGKIKWDRRLGSESQLYSKTTAAVFEVAKDTYVAAGWAELLSTTGDDIYVVKMAPPRFDPGPFPTPTATFVRGDFNQDGRLNIADPLAQVDQIFFIANVFNCHDAGDANDDGAFNIADPMFTVNYLFIQGAPPPPAPGPNACGTDPTTDNLPDCDYNTQNCPD